MKRGGKGFGGFGGTSGGGGMGHFSSGNAGLDYEEKYCESCVHGYYSETPCPIMIAHFLWQDKQDARLVLDELIPSDNGNGKCKMYLMAVTAQAASQS